MSFYRKYKRRIAVTGGAGFIGSNLLLYLVPKYKEYLFINIDCLTYAANLSNLKEIEDNDNYRFEKINISVFDKLQECFDKYEINDVINLAAESHVDRSIYGPNVFIKTNIIGTFNVLELARKYNGSFRFHHISTDEVFGSLGPTGQFTEMSRYDPSSPYAATKASSDHLVNAYGTTYGLDTVISNCSNNFGPYQFPEKLIPLVIFNALEGIPIPVYGDGSNIRDWLYVEDHCRAIDSIFHEGHKNQTYNIGGHNEINNMKLVKKICSIIDKITGGGPREELIEFVKDRPGHDWRYAIDASRISKELNWKPRYSFDTALQNTVEWYIKNREWLDNCINGHYKEYYKKTYENR